MTLIAVMQPKMIEPPPSDSKVETLLQHFPGPVAFCGERSGDSGMLLFSLLLMGFSVVAMINASGFALAAVYSLFALSCLMMVFGVFQVLPNSAGLTLSADGFRQRISPLHTQALWKNVGDFEVATIYSPYGGKAGNVIWYHDKTRESWWPHGVWRWHANAGINPVQELSIEQLAELLKRWRNKALTQES